MKKITVIVPVYNVENYLRKCLDSILLQTLREFEIICVDDGSYDKSQEILNEYAWKDSRVHVITQNNQGAYAARNVAIEKAQGEFLCFMDPDDYYPDNNVLLDMYKAATDNNVLVCGGGFQEDKSGNLISEWSGNLSQYTFSKDGIVYYKDYQFEYGFHRFLYKTEFIKIHKFIFPKLTYFEDPVFLVRVLSTAEKFYGLKRNTYCYRTGHKIVQWNEKKVLDLVKGIRENLILAKKYNYCNLISLEKARMENDYLDVIFSALNSIPNNEFISVLEDINKILFNNGLRIEYFIYKRKIQNMEYDHWQECSKIRNETANENKNWQKQIQEKKEQLYNFEEENSALKDELKENEKLNISQAESLKIKAEEINMYKDIIDSIKSQCYELKETQRNLENKLNITESKNKELEERLKNITEMFYHSTTWKVGNLILTVPKFIKKQMKRSK